MTTHDQEGQTRSVRVPLVEESVEVAKRVIDGDSVTVQTRVEEQVEWIRETLVGENVSVERVPVGRVVSHAPRIREVDGITIIPIVREVLHVEKRLMLVEEVHITRRTEETKVEQPVTLRSMHGSISRDAAGKE